MKSSRGSLQRFYVTVVSGMVVFSLLTYLPAKVVINGVTTSAVIWGTCAFICFEIIVLTFLFDSMISVIIRRRGKWHR